MIPKVCLVMSQVEINPKKILIIQLRQLGDVLLTTPAIKALREEYPSARISFLTEKASSPILAGNPNLDDVITIDKKQSYMDQLKVITDIRSRKFDLVVDFLANSRTAIITFFSGAKFTIAPKVRGRGLLYSVQVKTKGNYAVSHKLGLLSVLGIENADRTPCFNVKKEAEDKIKSFLNGKNIQDDEFLVCIDSTHRRITRKWIGEKYSELADRLKQKYKARVVFLWGPGEKDEVIHNMLLCKEKHILDPGSDINELAALLERADLLIGNCSFPRHMAASQNTPTLIILGSTGNEWTHPASIHKTVSKGLDCQPCNNNQCSFALECMKDLSVEEVMDGILKMEPQINKMGHSNA